uniref:Peptidase S1 domain-containing protein n=1 Tax=Setaria italica TaxID=4555 RepID=K3ZLN4_SETIT
MPSPPCAHVGAGGLFSSTSPDEASVVMLSWPISGHRTAVLGHISHRGRTMPDISGDNPYGFTMRLTEVDTTSESGSSGAPCFDGWGFSVGVLHGGDGRFSYFIPLNVVRQTLAQW